MKQLGVTSVATSTQPLLRLGCKNTRLWMRSARNKLRNLLKNTAATLSTTISAKTWCAVTSRNVAARKTNPSSAGASLKNCSRHRDCRATYARINEKSTRLQQVRLPLHLPCRASTSAGIQFAQARRVAFRKWIRIRDRLAARRRKVQYDPYIARAHTVER